jgi:hypothetical protein
MKSHHAFYLSFILLSLILFFSKQAESQQVVQHGESGHTILDLPEFSMQVFWDRNSWLNMVTDTLLTEDFELDQTGTYSTPYVTTNGILMNGVLGSITLQILSPGLVDDSKAAHFRDFSNKMSFTFPDTMAVAAFGFDYYRSELWELHVRDTVISLAPFGKGFIGVIITGGDITSFILTSQASAQGGLSIDNIIFSPSKGLFTVFEDRPEWQENIKDIILTEDFESESAGYQVYTTPFETNGGILMQGINAPIEFQILDGDLFPDSKAPHFRDFGKMMSFSFPDRRPVSALAFDYYYSGPDVWELHIEDSVIVLAPVVGPDFESQFIGIFIPEGSVSSFILTSPSQTQGGISVDNISFVYSTEPIMMPIITHITDVPLDQGKQVRLTWRKSKFDGMDAGDSTVVEYSVWRGIDDQENLIPTSFPKSYGDVSTLLNQSLTNGEWDFIQTVPAVSHDNYNVIVPTLLDSCITTGIHWTVFVVIAHTSNPLTFYVSKPDSGYSIDNLDPQVPKNLLATPGENLIQLSWGMVPDEDFNYFNIYRGVQSGFDPKEMSPYATTVDTFFVDSEVTIGTMYYYRIATIDFSGNQSQFSGEVGVIITGIEQIIGVPGSYALYQNYPNPFNPTTKIKFDLPTTTEITLKIFNILGEEVTTIISDRLNAGRYSYEWSPPAGIASGVYLYQLETEQYTETRKMVLIR